MGGHRLYLVGGAPRVGKSSLAQRLLQTDGIPWLPTDVLRTVLRRVLPQLDTIDQDPVDASLLAEFMYPHVEQAAEVCAEEAERFLIEGFELSPSYVARLQAALGQTEVAAGRLMHTLPESPKPPLVGYARLAGGREGAEERVSEAVREGASPHPSRRPVGQTPELHRYRLGEPPAARQDGRGVPGPAQHGRLDPRHTLGRLEHVQPL